MSEPLGKGKGPLEGITIIYGQYIRLNKSARFWARGRIFIVTEVHSWGVYCFSHDKKKRFYRAQWNEIGGVV